MMKQTLKQLQDLRERHCANPSYSGPRTLPMPAASKESISLAEASLGRNIPRQYSEFLLVADGWKHFRGSNCLLGTSDFINKSEGYLLAKEGWDVLVETDYFASAGLDQTSLFVIGYNEWDRDLWLLEEPVSPSVVGRAYWINVDPIPYASLEDLVQDTFGALSGMYD